MQPLSALVDVDAALAVRRRDDPALEAGADVPAAHAGGARQVCAEVLAATWGENRKLVVERVLKRVLRIFFF